MSRQLVKTCENRGLCKRCFVVPLSILNSRKYNKSVKLDENPQKLPKQPVPKLEDTLNKFLISVKPLLNDAEFASTVTVVKDFENGCGKKLQSLLEERAAKYTNWLAEWWLNAAYLEYRVSLVVNSNPGLLLPLRKFNNQQEQLQYAAKLLTGALKYKAIIDAGKVPLDKMGKFPLDMIQYYKVFGTCRLPHAKRDVQSFNSDSKHIVVCHNNHFFRVDVYGSDDKLLSEEQIVQQLNNVISRSAIPNLYGIGVLTADHRDVWASNYRRLLQDKTNQKSLEDLEKCIVVLCLDAPVGLWENNDDDTRRTIGGVQTIHGSGSTSNGCNRWFDKTIQFIVGADGISGLTYEHSPAEGQPVAFLTDYIVKYLNQKECKSESKSSCPIPPKQLNFNVTPEVVDMITEAKSSLDRLVYDFDMSCFKYGKYGKSFIKSQKMSPDSFLQIAMQYAYYRMYNQPGAHYESAATRMFVGGRTETIRSCSVESVQFAKAMLSPETTTEARIAALKRAVKSHKDYTIQALQGLGVDRHLLGLKLIALQNKMEVHPLYSDVGYVRSCHWKMSSSQVALKCDGFMCYGPVVPDGYAICYNPRNKYVNFAIGAFVHYPNTSACHYRMSLEQSLDDMQNTLKNIR